MLVAESSKNASKLMAATGGRPRSSPNSVDARCRTGSCGETRGGLKVVNSSSGHHACQQYEWQVRGVRCISQGSCRGRTDDESRPQPVRFSCARDVPPRRKTVEVGQSTPRSALSGRHGAGPVRRGPVLRARRPRRLPRRCPEPPRSAPSTGRDRTARLPVHEAARPGRPDRALEARRAYRGRALRTHET